MFQFPGRGFFQAVWETFWTSSETLSEHSKQSHRLEFWENIVRQVSAGTSAITWALDPYEECGRRGGGKWNQETWTWPWTMSRSSLGGTDISPWMIRNRRGSLRWARVFLWCPELTFDRSTFISFLTSSLLEFRCGSTRAGLESGLRSQPFSACPTSDHHGSNSESWLSPSWQEAFCLPTFHSGPTGCSGGTPTVCSFSRHLVSHQTNDD